MIKMSIQLEHDKINNKYYLYNLNDNCSSGEISRYKYYKIKKEGISVEEKYKICTKEW